MTNSLKRKEILIPVFLLIVFSFLFYTLPIKYFVISVIGIAGIFLVLYDIKIGILAGIFLVPFLPDMSVLLYMIFMVCVYLYKITFEEFIPLKNDSIYFPIILYVFIITIGTITSIDVSGSFRDLAIHISGIGFLFVIVNSVHKLEDLNKMATVAVLTGFLVSLIGLYQYVVGVDIASAWVDVENNPDIKARVFSVFGNPNILAEYLLMIIPISISLFISSKKPYKKIIFLGISLAMMLTLLLTFSRGSWVGFAFSIFIFIILIEKRLLFAMIPVGLLGLAFMPQSVLNRIMSITNFKDSSIAYRLKMWEITIDIIRDHWAFGVGFGHLPFKRTFETYIRTMPTYHAHNTFLETTAELGIPGLMIFLFLIFVLFKYSIQEFIKSENTYIKIMGVGLVASLSGILVQGAVENILYLPKIIISFWILVSFILVLMKISKEERMNF